MGEIVSKLVSDSFAEYVRTASVDPEVRLLTTRIVNVLAAEADWLSWVELGDRLGCRKWDAGGTDEEKKESVQEALTTGTALEVLAEEGRVQRAYALTNAAGNVLKMTEDFEEVMGEEPPAGSDLFIYYRLPPVAQPK